MLDEAARDAGASRGDRDVALLKLVVVDDDETDHLTAEHGHCGQLDPRCHQSVEVGSRAIGEQLLGHVAEVAIRPPVEPKLRD